VTKFTARQLHYYAFGLVTGLLLAALISPMVTAVELARELEAAALVTTIASTLIGFTREPIEEVKTKH